MVVGIKSVLRIAPSQTVADGVGGCLLVDGAQGISARFDAVAVCPAHEVGVIPVFPCPAAVYCHRRIVGDEVETVVAVAPCPAAFEHVSGVFGVGHVAAEAVYILARTMFRHRVVVVVGIAVEYEVVGPFPYHEAYTHAVMHSDVFYRVVVVAPAYGKRLRLCVRGDGYLGARDLEIAEVQVVGMDVEACHALAGRFHPAQVEHGPLPRIAEIADGLTCLPTFGEVEDAGIDALLRAHDVIGPDEIFTSADEEGVARGKQLLRTGDGGEGRCLCTGIGI